MSLCRFTHASSAPCSSAPSASPPAATLFEPVNWLRYLCALVRMQCVQLVRPAFVFRGGSGGQNLVVFTSTPSATENVGARKECGCFGMLKPKAAQWQR